ncbi:MAG TPA: WYL domain-containing protein [Bacillota bacterium]|nr:WYL domain-containing protein [Bacillota bacterium]HQI16268.1 WYL domain-containing protein [Bacillota bacterium]HQJ36739.1 WYL domain-containing protein [Bacillota bacterium]HQL35499.1 WYL domain-containing protein [Bacillota bacterium]HRS20624.1 WYL domain-containing protein [Clostridia bacterium]
MGPNLMLPLYILEFMTEHTDETNALLPTEIVKGMKKRYGNEIVSKTETVVENIEKLNLFFKSRYDGVKIIEAVNGIGNGRYKRNLRYFLSARKFDFSEILFLHKLLLNSNAISQDAIQDMCSKLSDFLSYEQRKLLKQNIVTDGSMKTRNKAVFINLENILKSIELKENIEFTYNEYNLEKKLVPRVRKYPYIVSPYDITCSYGSYFLTGYHIPTKEVRTYRLDKITQLRSNLEFDYYMEKGFDIKKHLENAVFMHADSHKIHVRLRCEMRILDDVIERFDNCRLDKDLTSENHFFATIPDTTMLGMKYWALEFSSACEVLEPEELRLEVRNTLARALAWYDEK